MLNNLVICLLPLNYILCICFDYYFKSLKNYYKFSILLQLHNKYFMAGRISFGNFDKESFFVIFK